MCILLSKCIIAYIMLPACFIFLEKYLCKPTELIGRKQVIVKIWSVKRCCKLKKDNVLGTPSEKLTGFSRNFSNTRVFGLTQTHLFMCVYLVFFACKNHTEVKTCFTKVYVTKCKHFGGKQKCS